MNNDDQSSKVKTKNITVGLIFGWIFGVVFAITGIVTLFPRPITGVAFLLASIICLPPVNKVFREKYNLSLSKGVKIIAAIVILILGFVIGGKTSKEETQNEVSSSGTSSMVASSTPKSSQQILETNLSTIASKKAGVTNTSYQGLVVEKADPDRPKDSKMLTVKINVTDFYSRDSLIRNTGAQASEIFQEIYSSVDLHPADAFIWYYGETNDRYGNKKNDVIISYSMDKTTYKKINWENFDRNSLCDFLKNEERISGLGSGPACNVLVNIQ